MKKFTESLLILCMASVLLWSCKKVKQTDAEIERQQWIEGFNDSIAYYENQTNLLNEELNKVNAEISSALDKFEYVENPREVEGYYILKGWTGKWGSANTSVVARLSKNEKFELLATLAGSTFNQIAATDGIERVTSGVQPNDQALNYRHKTYNSVCFISNKADTVAEFIANHMSERITIEFLENGKLKKNFVLPENEKIMVAETWNLLSSQLEAKDLQRELWIASKKIETFNHILNEENKEINKPEN